MRDAGASYLRTHLSWAEYRAPGGEEWYDWLIPTLGRAFDLLPCIRYTPPSLSRTGRASGAPRRLKDYVDFVDHVLDALWRPLPLCRAVERAQQFVGWGLAR